MNTQQLESFVQVAENLNFARAAELLNITQSAVSRQINSLETELGTKLFQRSTRRVSLTPSGMTFLSDVKDVLAKLQLATVKVQSHAKSNIQIVSFGCTSGADLVLISQILYQCRQCIPELHPFLRMIPHRSILDLFIHGEIDILLGFKDDIPMRDGIHYKEVTQVNICCAVPASHAYTQQKTVLEDDFCKESIIICNSYEIPSKVADIQHHLEHFFLPDSIYYCENLQEMTALIKAGYGIAVLPEKALTDSDVAYIPLEGIPPISYGLFYKDMANNPCLRSLVDIIHSMEL